MAPTRPSKAGDSLYCVLVESQRVNGLPRQKVVCYLGSVDERDREELWTRVHFCDRANAKLDQLQLARRERAKIEESIGLVVSRVPEDEAETYRREKDEWLQGLEQLLRFRNHISNLRKLFEGK